ncbi:cyclic-di-AMP-binding protein CbpB [Ligilactobacillus agilis]|uniref:cyclic-di-AMP-binding protein CbpB n=1 Tax=Ligilactobacillus agilis TaxID=1601 RepID=UPI001D5B968C|nr:cyclic-di-AMP-binding protein CbpB [Ligilactobacillus agilis]HJG05974.1 CBS domain-containing protein [Ligilactobacillus agilis]
MIAKAVEEMFSQRKGGYLIPAEIVANVSETNNLNHALLVLTKVKYAKIPVLDKEQRVTGLLSLAMITETMLGLNGIDPSRLNRMTVKEIMQTDFPKIQAPYDVEEILHLLVDQPFLTVVDQAGVFLGIITRREIMKEVNYFAHDLEKQYLIEPKAGYLEETKNTGTKVNLVVPTRRSSSAKVRR